MFPLSMTNRPPPPQPASVCMVTVYLKFCPSRVEPQSAMWLAEQHVANVYDLRLIPEHGFLFPIICRLLSRLATNRSDD